MKEPFYIAQIVPAPEGWVACGSPAPGEEFWYESTDGKVQIFPDEYSGWVLQEDAHPESNQIYSNPESAFQAAVQR